MMISYDGGLDPENGAVHPTLDAVRYGASREICYGSRMQEPSPRASRLVAAGSAAAFVPLGGGGFLLGRSTAPLPKPAVVSPLRTPGRAPVVPEIPVARILSRADIIATANAAADATSSGAKVPEIRSATEESRFEIDLPFGCNETIATWSYGERDRGLMSTNLDFGVA